MSDMSALEVFGAAIMFVITVIVVRLFVDLFNGERLDE